jgi:hypothetical protein
MAIPETLACTKCSTNVAFFFPVPPFTAPPFPLSVHFLGFMPPGCMLFFLAHRNLCFQVFSVTWFWSFHFDQANQALAIVLKLLSLNQC